MILSVIVLVAPAVLFAEQTAIDGARQQILVEVSNLSLDMMIAEGRDPCKPTAKESAVFRKQNEKRWGRIETALQNRFGAEASEQFGVVIPEACRHARSTPWRERRAAYQRDLHILEQSLAITDQE